VSLAEERDTLNRGEKKTGKRFEEGGGRGLKYAVIDRLAKGGGTDSDLGAPSWNNGGADRAKKKKAISKMTVHRVEHAFR